ncbi:MAG: porin [Akkermansiaceae bacterium]|nr:porin [Akkermansiaceae bacterium]
MSKINLLTGTVFTAISLSGSALAGDVVAEAPAPSNNGSWCESLNDFGKFYKNDNASFIQEMKFFGRFQWQAGSVDGDDFSGDSVNDDFTEIRRLRIGTQVKFFNQFKLKVEANLEEGGPNDHEFGYDGLDVAELSYSAGDIMGFEDVALTYGRQKFKFSQEAHTSSKKIKTIERSNISNFFYGSYRPTGLTVSGKKGGVKSTFSVFSTDIDDELAQWGEGLAYYGNLQFDAAGGNVNLDLIYNDVDADEVDLFSRFEWAASAAYTTEVGAWELMANVLYGESQDGDAAYGVVLMPSTFLIEESLEFVARYQYAGADNDDLSLTSRYAKRAGGDIGDKGNENHTLYAGLNYYLCGNSSKVQVGVEYETMEQEDGDDADATTLWAAYRMYF